jgi:hypothetical protein
MCKYQEPATRNPPYQVQFPKETIDIISSQSDEDKSSIEFCEAFGDKKRWNKRSRVAKRHPLLV